MLDIPRKVMQPSKSERFAPLLSPTQGIAKLDSRLAGCVGARHPGRHECVRSRVHVELPFLGHVALDAPTAE
jgi:hypothetical protein